MSTIWYVEGRYFGKRQEKEPKDYRVYHRSDGLHVVILYYINGVFSEVIVVF